MCVYLLTKIYVVKICSLKKIMISLILLFVLFFFSFGYKTLVCQHELPVLKSNHNKYQMFHFFFSLSNCNFITSCEIKDNINLVVMIKTHINFYITQVWKYIFVCKTYIVLNQKLKLQLRYLHISQYLLQTGIKNKIYMHLLEKQTWIS